MVLKRFGNLPARPDQSVPGVEITTHRASAGAAS